MPVDTSMYGMIKPIDAMGAIEGGMRMRDLIDERKKKSAIQGAYKQGMQVGPDGKVAFDHNLTASALAQGGYGQEAYQAQQQGQSEQQKQIEATVKRAQFGAQILGAARNQDEWNQGLQQLQNHMDVSSLPAEFSPQTQKFLVDSAMTLSDRLSEQWKQKNYDLEKDWKQKSYGLERDKFEHEKNKPQAGAAPPSGYRFRPDGSLEAIPGGPADAKVGAVAEKEQKQKEMAIKNANIVNQDIGRAMEIIDNNRLATGGEAAFMGKIPGTAAHNLDKMLDSVKANAAFDKLQAMREASPTGGALGAVSDREMGLLQAAVGSLDKSLPKETLKDNLKRVANLQLDIIHGPGKGPPRHQLSFDEAGQSIAGRGGASSSWGVDEANAGEKQTFSGKDLGFD